MPRHPYSRLVKFRGSGCFSGLQEFRDYKADAGRQDGPKGGQEYVSQRIEVTGTGILLVRCRNRRTLVGQREPATLRRNHKRGVFPA